MGGKKKKSAPQAAPSVAPSAVAAAGRTGAAAAGNGVAEETKKQPASNKVAKPTKESKSKGTVCLFGWCRIRNNNDWRWKNVYGLISGCNYSRYIEQFCTTVTALCWIVLVLLVVAFKACAYFTVTYVQLNLHDVSN